MTVVRYPTATLILPDVGMPSLVCHY